MLTAGSLVSSATAVRVAVGCIELLAERAGPLVELAVTASVGRDDKRKAQAAFRDELMALAQDSVDISTRELRRGIDELDRCTRPEADEAGVRPHRPHRVKL
jgi:hypothetical protein